MGGSGVRAWARVQGAGEHVRAGVGARVASHPTPTRPPPLPPPPPFRIPSGAGYFVASVAPSMDAANAILPTYITSLLLLAGFTLRRPDQPAWWKW